MAHATPDWRLLRTVIIKYLSDADYENAVLAYKEAIDLNPKQEEAYLKLADAYLQYSLYCTENGDSDKAESILNSGIKELSDAKEKNSFIQLSEKIKRLLDSQNDIETQNNKDDEKELKSEIKPELESIKQLEEETIEMPQDNASLFRDYFFSNYSAGDFVCLADVTHDGQDEMIVVHEEDDWNIIGKVFTLKSGEISCIYEKSGGKDHVGQFFNWYLVPTDDGWCLGDEYFLMWQGIGDTGFNVYYLSTNGDYIENTITPTELYRIYYSDYSELNIPAKAVETNPNQVFQ